MKIFKYAYIVLMGIMLVSISSCSGDDIEYTPAEQVEGMQVYFSSSNASSITLSSQETSFDIAISRINTAEAATVALSVTDESGLYSVPNSVSFSSGESKTNITVTYDPEEVGFDNYSNLTIAIADEGYTTPYGTSQYTVKVGIPSPWTSLGKATYSDAFMFEDSYQVELQQNDLDKNLFRLVRPYREGLVNEGYGGVTGEEQEYPEFRLLQPGDEWKGTTVTQEGLVAYNDISTEWINTNYGATIWLLHPSRLTSLADESNWLHNKVISYQENGLPAIVQLAPYYYMFGVGGWNYTQNDGMVTIVFPGVVIKDYSVGVTYLGRLIGADESNKVMANITLGEDVTSAKYAMAADVNPSDLAQGIIDGSVESVTIEASGDIQIPVTENGDYTIVVVPYDGEEAQEMAYTSFEITLGASEWESIGMAQYTDGFVGPAYGGNALTYEVEVLESNKTPGLYRLVNTYGAGFPYNEEGDYDASRKYYMEINATDPEGVYIELQDTGLNWGDGNFYVYSYAAYYLDNGYSLTDAKSNGKCGTLVDGVITFPVKELLCMIGTDLYYANRNGEFKIVLPTATSTAAVTSSRVASRSASTFSKQFDKNNKVVRKLPNNRYFSTMTIAE